MDNADTVSISESSTRDSKKKKDKKSKNQEEDKDKEKEMQKKKMKVLKQALTEEKEKKTKVETQLKEAQDQISKLMDQHADKDKKYSELNKQKQNLEASLLQGGGATPKSKQITIPSSATKEVEITSPTKVPTGPKKALSTLYSDQVTAVKKSVTQRLNKDDNPYNEDLQIMSEMWEKDKANKKEEMAKLNSKIEEVEKELAGKDDLIQKAEQETNDSNENMTFQAQQYDERIDQMNSRLAVQDQDIQTKDTYITQLQTDHKTQVEELNGKFNKEIDQLKLENSELLQSKNQLQDEKFALDEVIENKNDEILQLQKDCQLHKDEVDLRKLIVDQLSANLLKHESESQIMSQKLTLMKNQIMEYDRYVGMNRKYGAVRIQTIKHLPVTFEFIEEKEKKNVFIWYLIIDSRTFANTINCQNIEELIEKPDGKLSLTYYIWDGKGKETDDISQQKFLRKNENYDCCENKLLLKAFEGITKRIIEQMGGKQNYDDHISFLSSGKQVTNSTPKIMKKIVSATAKSQVKEVESETQNVKQKKLKIETTQEIKNAMQNELYGDMAEMKSPAELEQMKYQVVVQQKQPEEVTPSEATTEPEESKQAGAKSEAAAPPLKKQATSSEATKPKKELNSAQRYLKQQQEKELKNKKASQPSAKAAPEKKSKGAISSLF